jgi:hypothetical protein
MTQYIVDLAELVAGVQVIRASSSERVRYFSAPYQD